MPSDNELLETITGGILWRSEYNLLFNISAEKACLLGEISLEEEDEEEEEEEE